MDMNGCMIFSDLNKQFMGEYLKTIDMSAQSKGIYFIELLSEGQTTHHKIVIQ
jgi:hypothetical protein